MAEGMHTSWVMRTALRDYRRETPGRGNRLRSTAAAQF
jgi:hypothetical protein